MKQGDLIFLSASMPWREGWLKGVDLIEIEEAVISIARAVFSRGGRLIFGGHPSISPLVASVAGEYYPQDRHRLVRPVVTFQSEWFRGSVPDQTWEMVEKGLSTIEWVGLADTEEVRACVAQRIVNKPDKELSPAQRQLALRARNQCLTLMRQCMLGEMPPHLDGGTMRQWIETRHHNGLLPLPRAMIVIGGMEGCLEEAAIFVRQRKGEVRDAALPPGAAHIHTFPSGGGAAKTLLNWDPGFVGRLLDTHWLSHDDAAALRHASEHRLIHDAEKAWNDVAGNYLSEEERQEDEEGAAADFPLQPYEAMAQRLLDLLDEPAPGTD